MTIRKIKKKDNNALAFVIRETLKEFKANKPGTVYFDETTDNLFDVFQTSGSNYFVAEEDGVVCGGAGIYPTDNLPQSTCELVKLYLSAPARGKGIGRLLMEICILEARTLGYTSIYLETMPELKIAIPLYEKFGFNYLPAALGNSGHSGCDIWMIKDLTT